LGRWKWTEVLIFLAWVPLGPLMTFFCTFKAFWTGAVGCDTFLPTPFCCLTGTVFFGFVTIAFGGILGLPATLVADCFLAPALAAGLAAALGAALAVAFAAGFVAALGLPAAAGAALLVLAALAAAAGLGAGVFEEAFFSAGLAPADAALAALGAGAGFDEVLAPDAAAGADAGFFFSSFLPAPDSEERSSRYRRRSLRAWHPLWAVAPFKMDLDASHGLGMTDPP
jgi:hypothetical protein